MGGWTMGWGDESEPVAPLLPHSAWVPQPVPAGSVRAVRALIHGFYGLPEEPLLITSIAEDGTIHIYGAHDNSRGAVVRAPDTGIILRASGVEGTSPWRFSVIATRLLDDDDGLLEPVDVTPPLI